MRRRGGFVATVLLVALAALDDGLRRLLRFTASPAGSDPVTAPGAGLVMTAEDMAANRGC